MPKAQKDESVPEWRRKQKAVQRLKSRPAPLNVKFKPHHPPSRYIQKPIPPRQRFARTNRFSGQRIKSNGRLRHKPPGNSPDARYRCSVLPQNSLFAPFSSSHKHIRSLGKGGQGEASLWKNVHTGKLVVAKTVNGARNSIPYEAKILQSMPKFVRIISYLGMGSETLTSRGSHLMMLEYCDGGDLYKYRDSMTSKCPEPFIWHVFKQLSQALAFLHSGIELESQRQPWRTIIHRDIKPENVLLAAPGPGEKFPNVKLADFGLARYFSYMASAEDNISLCGTWNWQAPEMPLTTPAGDIWAVGGIIHFLSLGHAPVKKYDVGPKKEWICENVPLCIDRRDAEYFYYLAGHPRHVEHINLHINQDHYSNVLDRWMMRALEVNVNKRITASELVRYVVPSAHVAISLFDRGREILLDRPIYELDGTDDDMLAALQIDVVADEDLNDENRLINVRCSNDEVGKANAPRQGVQRMPARKMSLDLVPEILRLELIAQDSLPFSEAASLLIWMLQPASCHVNPVRLTPVNFCKTSTSRIRNRDTLLALRM